MSLQLSELSVVRGANAGLATGPVIAAFGTSLTHSGGWIEPLQEQLTRCFGQPVRVLDFGRDGKTSEWALTSVGQIIEAHPDVVLIEFSVNDAAWFKGFSLRRSRENTTAIIQAIRRALPEARIFLMTISPAIGPRRWIRLNLDAYYSLYQSLATELGIGFIDNRPAWKLLTAKELRQGIPDGAHPLPELASRLIVPTITRAIIPECTGRG